MDPITCNPNLRNIHPALCLTKYSLDGLLTRHIPEGHHGHQPRSTYGKEDLPHHSIRLAEVGGFGLRLLLPLVHVPYPPEH